MATTGDRIKDIREKKKLTQEQLAEASGISKGFLSEVENNKRNISSQILLQIANALGASVDYLLGNKTTGDVTLQSPVVIPFELSKAAEKLNLTYNQTLELLDAYNSVAARRSNKETKVFTVEDWIKFHKLIKNVFN